LNSVEYGRKPRKPEGLVRPKGVVVPRVNVSYHELELDSLRSFEKFKKSIMKETSMKNFTDAELAELADWAEKNERENAHPDLKKAYGAIRQGTDWLIRFRVKEKQQKIEQAGNATSGPSAVRQ
jgi:hypothetical protein